MERCSQCEARGGLGIGHPSPIRQSILWCSVRPGGTGVCIGTRDVVYAGGILHRPAISMVY